MRICFVSTGDFTHIGAYLEHFQLAGHDVRFIALSPSPPRPVPTYNLGFGGGYDGTRGKWRYPVSMVRARALVRKLNPDIVHTHYATSGGLAGLVCGFRPTVVTAHGTDLNVGSESKTWRVLLKAVFDHAACVNTVSEDLKAKAVGLGVEPGKIEVLTLGVDTARFCPAEPGSALARGPLRLLCTRRLEPAYGNDTILEALALLRRAGLDFQMTFAGDGSLRRELETQARRLDVARHCEFLGEVGGASMPFLLRRHDAYLSASRGDGTSLSLLEAMAVGIFPIVSRIPANTAWLTEGESGFMHAPGDAGELAARILELAARPRLAAAAAASNRAKVLARGDRRSNMLRLERLYGELLGRR